MSFNNQEVQIFEETNKVLSERSVCQICQLISKKYTCPRCNVEYCSVECFKSTSHAGCSESFYKDSFLTELKQKSLPNNEKQKMLRMLQDFEENEHEIDDELSLENRLSLIDIQSCGQEDIWACLNDTEKKNFNEIIKNPKASASLVSPFEPWWHNEDNEVKINLNSKAQKVNHPPAMSSDIKKLSKLLGSKLPSEYIKYNLINVLYCYAYFCRHFNGCMDEFLNEYVVQLINSSTYLHKGESFTNTNEAIQSGINSCIKISGNSSSLWVLTILDVEKILLGRIENQMYVLSALSDMKNYFKCCKKRMKNTNSANGFQKTLFHCVKKLQFLESWTVQEKGTLFTLAIEVGIANAHHNKISKDKMLLCKDKLVNKHKQLIVEL